MHHAELIVQLAVQPKARALGTRVAGMVASTPIFERFTNACHTNILDSFERCTIACHTNISDLLTTLLIMMNGKGPLVEFFTLLFTVAFGCSRFILQIMKKSRSALSQDRFPKVVSHSLVQPRESKLRTEDKAQAHKSSSEFEIAAPFQIMTERQFQIQSYLYELEHYPPY